MRSPRSEGLTGPLRQEKGCRMPHNRMAPSRRTGLWGLALLLVSAIAQGAPGAPGADWPESIATRVGTLSVRFESRSFWTLYRIDHEDVRLGLDTWGSHYGSVAKFPGVGFIGSGHTENEDEVLESLAFYVDGATVPVPSDVPSAQSVRLEKCSRLRTLQLHTVVTVLPDRIYESVSVTATEDTPLELMYHFMHPWDPAMTHYVGEQSNGTVLRGTFDNDKKQELDVPTAWSAVYNEAQERGALTVVLEAPDQDWRTRYWDVPKRYRKHYFTTFLAGAVLAGTRYDYRIVTIPFQADTGDWENRARKLAEEARETARKNRVSY